MTLEQIEALKAPKGRPAGDSYESYIQLCFKGGVPQPLAKSDWSKLPEVGDPNALVKACADDGDEFHGGEKLQKELFKGDGDEEYDESEGDEDDEGDGDEDEAAGDETETAEADSGEGESMDDAEKGGIAVTDLMKAIDAYSSVEDALTASGDSSRESFLQARLDAGTISKSERSELGRIWSGAEDDVIEEPMQKSLTETMQEDDNASHLVDASDFLRTLVKGVDTRMEQVLGEVSRDGRATRELLKAQGSLIKSLASHAGQQDSLIKAMASRLSQVENLPAPRRAVTARPDHAVARELGKSSFREASDNRMSKSQVTEGLRALMIHASESEDQGAMNRITHATSLYEQTGQIPENVMSAVRQVS